MRAGRRKYYYRRFKTPPEHGEKDDQLQEALDEVNRQGGEIVAVLEHGHNWFTMIFRVR